MAGGAARGLSGDYGKGCYGKTVGMASKIFYGMIGMADKASMCRNAAEQDAQGARRLQAGAIAGPGLKHGNRRPVLGLNGFRPCRAGNGF